MIEAYAPWCILWRFGCSLKIRRKLITKLSALPVSVRCINACRLTLRSVSSSSVIRTRDGWKETRCRMVMRDSIPNASYRSSVHTSMRSARERRRRGATDLIRAKHDSRSRETLLSYRSSRAEKSETATSGLLLTN